MQLIVVYLPRLHASRLRGANALELVPTLLETTSV